MKFFNPSEYHRWLSHVTSALAQGTSLQISGEYEADADLALQDLRLALPCTPPTIGNKQSPLCGTKDVDLMDAVAQFSLARLGSEVAARFQSQDAGIRKAAVTYILQKFDLPPANQ